MEQRFDAKVEDLRRKSRTLIKRMQETSKRVNDEISLLRSQSSLTNNLAASKNPDYWRMRNDSGGVGGTLCPEYFHSEDGKRADRCGSKAAIGKIIIPSKSHLERKIVLRKPVKECYCYPETQKTNLRSQKITDRASFPCNYCKSNFDVEISLPNVEATVPLVSASFSGETRRRIEKITYSPTSEFLRRVQKKFSTQKKKHNCSGNELSVTSSSSRQSAQLTRDSGRGESAMEIRFRGGKNNNENDKRTEVRSISDTRGNYEIQRSINVANEGRIVGRRKIGENSRRSSSINDRSSINIDDSNNENLARKPRTSLRKTIRSAECLKDNQRKKERGCNKHSTKRIVRTISAQSRCCVDKDFENFETRRRAHRHKCDCEMKKCSEGHCCPNTWRLSRDTKDRMPTTIGDNEDKVRELNKFRNDNYFETHGSNQTLVTSSRSSGSLEQYVLNDRLFPEPVTRIHRDDLVVTMPPCATKQRKRIHYFPRYIVKQDKSACNTNYNRKKRRSQSCGLTGHAVDLGILKKPCEVINSLALRHQKGVLMARK